MNLRTQLHEIYFYSVLLLKETIDVHSGRDVVGSTNILYVESCIIS